MKFKTINQIIGHASDIGQSEIISMNPLDNSGELIKVVFLEFQAVFSASNGTFIKYKNNFHFKKVLDCIGDFVCLKLMNDLEIIFHVDFKEPVDLDGQVEHKRLKLMDKGVKVFTSNGTVKFHNWIYHNWAILDPDENEFLAVKEKNGKVFGKSCKCGEFQKLRFLED